MADESEIFERYELELQGKLREDSQFITLASLAIRLNYRLSEVERLLLTSLITIKQRETASDPSTQVTADSATCLVHEFAEKTDHPFWEYAIFLLVPHQCPERLFQVATFRHFRNLMQATKRLSYLVVTQEDARLIDDFAQQRAQQDLGLRETTFREEFAWRQVKHGASAPAHPFWLFAIGTFLNTCETEATSPDDSKRSAP